MRSELDDLLDEVNDCFDAKKANQKQASGTSSNNLDSNRAGIQP